MATVVITFFLLTQIYVYKMDAEFLDKRRSGEISRREKRWSMNSQRLEEIVAELMRPISDVRRSFDTDLSALLEEYLTEAGLHALEASEGDEDGETLVCGEGGAPNFTELALLLQHSASVYGRKVDFLYQHVLSVSDSLQHSAQEVEREEAGPEGSSKRRRAVGAGGAEGAGSGFDAIPLSGCAGSARDVAAPRPPPTLPRVYVELEPRTLSDHDHVLHDYKGEPIGLLPDFHVAWRLQEGMLVDELEGWDGGGGGSRSLRPIPLMELQAAIQAAAPPALPPRPATPAPPTPHPDSPRALSQTPTPLCASTPLQARLLPAKKERKRKSEAKIDDLLAGSFKISINKKVRRRLQKLQEFSVHESWVKGVVELRTKHILKHRALHQHLCTDFPGIEGSTDLGVAAGCAGFAGWSHSEAAAAHKSATCVTIPAGAGAEADSDDDGFFEQSSLGDSDASRVDDSILTATATATTPTGPPLNDTERDREREREREREWQAAVVSRAELTAARPLHVRECAARVLAALPTPPAHAAPAAPCWAVLRHAEDAHDVAGLFLATLFLANSGNVEIIQGPPLTLNSFQLRLLSTDERLYSIDDSIVSSSAPPRAPPRPPPAR